MSPFRNILKLSIGDFVSKVAYFLAFVYMAQKLGVAGYGVLEFAVAIRTYMLLAADAGLELWAVREAAKGLDIHGLVARVAPIRLVLATFSFGSVIGILAVLPDNPNLRRILPLLALTVFLQAFNLKWVFMGQERMMRVAVGLVASQLVFAGCIFLLVRQPADLIWVPLAFILGELLIVVYFWRLFTRLHGPPKMTLDWSGIRSLLQPVLTLGASHGLALMNYNIGSILIGVMAGPGPVGWYAAAYKPITAGLALPVSYFLGLFPSLSRQYKENKKKFRSILVRSFRLTAIFALPLGVGGTLLAEPLIGFLFGRSYARSVPVLQLLAWSAVLVTLRGNFRQSLNAAGKQRLDLACAISAVTVNVGLNLVLIPSYSIYGSAAATLASEVWWFVLAGYFFSRHVMPLKLLPALWRPILAAAGMGAFLVIGAPVQWMLRAAMGVVVYFLILFFTGEPEVVERLSILREKARRRPLLEVVGSPNE
jgi:O-antigen/teichoic acid export membrane protein